jgi:hypothetical protein
LRRKSRPKKPEAFFLRRRDERLRLPVVRLRREVERRFELERRRLTGDLRFALFLTRRFATRRPLRRLRRLTRLRRGAEARRRAFFLRRRRLTVVFAALRLRRRLTVVLRFAARLRLRFTGAFAATRLRLRFTVVLRFAALRLRRLVPVLLFLRRVTRASGRLRITRENSDLVVFLRRFAAERLRPFLFRLSAPERAIAAKRLRAASCFAVGAAFLRRVPFLLMAFSLASRTRVENCWRSCSVSALARFLRWRGPSPAIVWRAVKDLVGVRRLRAANAPRPLIAAMVVTPGLLRIDFRGRA